MEQKNNKWFDTTEQEKNKGMDRKRREGNRLIGSRLGIKFTENLIVCGVKFI